MKAGAVLSALGGYRWRLWRRWEPGPVAMFVMLNPSTADAREDDPTIRRCVGFARAWGLGGLHVVNVYGLRATDPAELKGHPRPGHAARFGDNRLHVQAAGLDLAAAGGVLVAAWGASILDPAHGRAALDELAELRHAGVGWAAEVTMPGPCDGCGGCDLRERVARLEAQQEAGQALHARQEDELRRIWDSVSGRFRVVYERLGEQDTAVGALQEGQAGARGAIWALQLLVGGGLLAGLATVARVVVGW